MDRDWLAAGLEARDSIEAIAREVGKHPSTVAYWADRYGLVSTHAARHAPRGGISREVLVELACEGLGIRGMAARLGCSTATVRHWLRKHDVETRRTSQLDPLARAVRPAHPRPSAYATSTERRRSCSTATATTAARSAVPPR